MISAPSSSISISNLTSYPLQWSAWRDGRWEVPREETLHPLLNLQATPAINCGWTFYRQRHLPKYLSDGLLLPSRKHWLEIREAENKLLTHNIRKTRRITCWHPARKPHWECPAAWISGTIRQSQSHRGRAAADSPWIEGAHNSSSIRNFTISTKMHPRLQVSTAPV